ncbi:hypothetical protein KDK95_09940 [Actinospica sp. MGRD01-02]|uniref:Anti-bacteriophage protein A/HamA C-terminal domain-containing protein n=1 Tax=Actinospica acidithermotolerans TaxID=2828514 RepID=A0A941E5D1_9ACTN|nr:hypothetical protein [Actinospica acidithermotolerans]MBR7826625.1 hypothetical protein [Actinospica acidithermotolerans]
MLDRWLGRERRRQISPMLDLCEVLVDDGLDEADVQEALGRELARNYLNPAERAVLVDVFADLGLDAMARQLAASKLPTSVAVRHGDFGEALTGVLFRRVRRYCVPIMKLRYKHRPNQPVQSCDLIAFRLTRSPQVVAAPEVKTRTSKRLGIGEEAAVSLESAIATLPSAIQFAAARLLEAGHAAIGSRIMMLLAADYVLERHIVLVHDEDLWDERIVSRTDAAVREKTDATVIRVKGLKDTIASAYDAVPQAVVAVGVGR